MSTLIPINVTKRYKLFSIYELIKHHNFLESLILAQDERWRRA